MKIKPIDFCFEKIGDKYFISNDSGSSILLDEREFEEIFNGNADLKLENKLAAANFLCDKFDFEKYIQKSAVLKKYSFAPPSLHIIVLTLKCNHFCVYCRAVNSRVSKNTDMSFETAKKTIDFILSSPSRNLTVEFQGGEALINWDVFKRSVLYLKKRNKIFNKDLDIAVVTNLSLMSQDKLKFLVENSVSVCTSLDGPKETHNKNRIYLKASSYDNVVKWLKLIRKEVEKRKSGRRDFMPSALMTTTRHSFSKHKEIIDEYRKLKLGGIFLRPLSPIGYAQKIWDEIGYKPSDFLKFYEQALDYALEINLKGEKFIERNAAIKLKKIILGEDPNFLDLRSPCGAGIGQLAYNYEGDIYTCDEGRMLAANKDEFFKLGNVFSSSYKDIISSPALKVCAMCSCLENQPLCFRCAFKPYCGICPVHNYQMSKNPWGAFKFSGWCDIEKGIFKILIKKMSNKKYMEIFKNWYA